MPTNLPPDYFEVEKRYKQASTPQEKVLALEELISTVPKHKGTDKLRADLRKRLSKLKEEGLRKKKSGRTDLYTVERQGAAQVALVGFANSGKSSLLQSLTNARPVIADYPMSTVMPLSGMMPFEDIQFQLVDLPPIGNESTDGWVSGILRLADLIMLVIDLAEDPVTQVELLLDQFAAWKIPLQARVEDGSVKQGLKPKPTLIAATKSDASGSEHALRELRGRKEPGFPVAAASNRDQSGLEDLKRQVFETSGMIRVYSKQPGKEAEKRTPFTLPKGSTVLDLAESIHKDFVKDLKYACIWGSAKFDGQRVQRDSPLHDGDLVELHVK